MASNWFCISVVAALTIALGNATAFAADLPAPQAPPRSIRDITTLLDQYKPDPAKAAEVRKILDQAPPDTQDRKDLARFYKQKAMAAQDVGAAKEFVTAMRKVVELGGEWDLIEDLWHLGSAEFQAGNLQQAMASRTETLTRLPAGTQPGKRMNAYGDQAMLHARFGDLDSATKALETAEEIYRAGLNTRAAIINRHTWTFHLDRHKAGLLFQRGRLAEAEALVRHAAREMPGVRQDQEMARIQRDGSSRNTDGHMDWIEFNNQGSLAKVVAAQSRLTEAELIARGALTNGIKSFGRYSYYTGTLVKPYAGILLAQGRYAEAEQLVRAGIDIFRQIGTPDDSLNIFDLRSDLGIALVAQRRYKEALAEFAGMRAAFATMPSLQVQLARGNAHWALALIETGDTAGAVVMLDTLIASSRQWLGADHPDTVTLQALRAMALARSGQVEASLGGFRTIQAALITEAQAQAEEASPLKAQSLSLLLETYLRVLGEVHGTPAENAAGIDAAAEAFRIADVLRGQSTQGAVVASAVRAAANDPAIGKEIRKEQDLQQESVALFRIMRDLMNAPPEKQLPKVIADMKARIEAIKKERAALQADIEKRFPAYANLIRPQPPSLAETLAVLRPGEALINIFSSDTATYLWAFRKDGAVAFASAKLSRDELTRRVQGLRKALDPGDAELARGIPDFDLDAAHRLYTDLLLPVAAGWQGATTLLVAANGALSQLPLALLPTQKVAVKADPKLPYGQFKDVPWLIRQAAFTQLPSVNALVSLRKLPVASAERAAFVGFGDPQFSDSPIQVASSRGRLRNLNISRPSLRDVEQGKAAEWMDYGKIPPLPDTRDEILALAQALKANPEADVFLGSKASKENLKKLDLAKRKVVAFATHGLLAGDFPGVSEPSLALANPGGGKHGLLTLEDILGLKLDADWVVLSACNTAGGDGQGADALSGLGRGFFYAGSRALLVTHWPVESVSAKTLVTGIFERQAADPKLSRAEALRQSMLSLMQAKSTDNAFSYAHPLFWAPYTLVGEGGI